jgi:hypothetical protein
MMIQAHNHEEHARAFAPHSWDKATCRCSYCGSISPTLLAKLIADGAIMSLADMKYGWPHKFYVRHENLDSGMAKFYSNHIRDATPEELPVIENAMGFKFQFQCGGFLSWSQK